MINHSFLKCWLLFIYFKHFRNFWQSLFLCVSRCVPTKSLHNSPPIKIIFWPHMRVFLWEVKNYFCGSIKKITFHFTQFTLKLLSHMISIPTKIRYVMGLSYYFCGRKTCVHIPHILLCGIALSTTKIISVTCGGATVGPGISTIYC